MRILREPSIIDPTSGVVKVEPKTEPVVEKKQEVKQDTKPQSPRQPTADELKQKFEIEPGDPDFIDSFKVEQLPVKKVEEVEKKEEKKEELKKEEPKKEEVKIGSEVKEETAPVIDLTKPIVPAGTQPKQRDYTSFNAEETKILKAMSNEAFAYTSNLIKQNKELSGLKDASYLQHPNAYVLDPRFQEEQQNIQYFQQEAAYWQQQL